MIREEGDASYGHNNDMILKLVTGIYKMGIKEKLIKRLKTKPKDFTFAELETLLRYFSYELSNKGKTSGSRVTFISDNHSPIMMHKPHNRK